MPAEVERCVRTLKADPDFEAFDGKTKSESAWAVCMKRYKERNKDSQVFSDVDINSLTDEQIMQRDSTLRFVRLLLDAEERTGRTLG